MKKYFLLFSAILFLMSCGPKKGTDATVLSAEKLADLSKAVCADGKALKEKTISGHFEDLARDADAFIFSIAKSNCVLTSDLNESFPTPFGVAHIEIEISSDCLQNNSAWKVSQSGISSPEAFINLKSLDDKGTPALHVTGTRDMQANYASQYLGLRKLTCE